MHTSTDVHLSPVELSPLAQSLMQDEHRKQQNVIIDQLIVQASPIIFHPAPSCTRHDIDIMKKVMERMGRDDVRTIENETTIENKE